MLKNFSVSTRTRFVDLEGQRAERGDWTPQYYKYYWEGSRQYLVVSSVKKVKIFEVELELDPVLDDVSYKDMVCLKEEGTYYLHRKTR